MFPTRSSNRTVASLVERLGEKPLASHTSLRDIWIRFWSDLYGRAGALFTFRLVLQPLVAGAIAFRAGLRDARQGRPAYLWSICGDRAARMSLIKEGWRDLAQVLSLAIAIDLLYQLIVLRWIYPLETLAIAVIVAVLPYLLLRAAVNRAVRWKARRLEKKFSL